jgi:hypothetical protein
MVGCALRLVSNRLELLLDCHRRFDQPTQKLAVLAVVASLWSFGHITLETFT